MGVRVNDRDWPLVYVSYSDEYTMADVEVFWRDLAALLDRQQRFAMVTIGMPSQRGRGTAKAQMAYFQRELDRMGAYVACAASVVSADVKSEMDGRRGDSRRELSPYPVAAFLSEAEAVDWAHTQLHTPVAV